VLIFIATASDHISDGGAPKIMKEDSGFIRLSYIDFRKTVSALSAQSQGR